MKPIVKLKRLQPEAREIAHPVGLVACQSLCDDVTRDMGWWRDVVSFSSTSVACQAERSYEGVTSSRHV
jgi:hypothetical protein